MNLTQLLSLSATPLLGEKNVHTNSSVKLQNPNTIVHPQPSSEPSGGSRSPADEVIRLEALNHTKDKLLSLVGHDLRITIGGILAITDMLDKCLKEGDIEEVTRLSGLIRRSSLDANDLLNDLVTWTRKSGNDLHFQLESADSYEIINSEVNSLGGIANRKNQTIRIEAHGSGMMRVDLHMFRAVLRNLLTNALKFSHTDSEVVVRSSRKKGEWEFQVCDTGVGMSPEIQDLLLKIDDRKQKLGTSGEKGSGLGLLLCEDFVHRHGGHLTWQSSLGEGTTFTIPDLLG